MERTLATLLIALVALGAFPLRAGGDPVEAVEGPQYRSATWSFDTPADYTLSPSTGISAGNLSLTATPSSLTWTAQSDFGGNSSVVDNLTIAATNLRLAGNPADLVASGDFSSPVPWTFASSPNVSASAPPSEGQFNGTAASPEVPFSGLNATAGWFAQGTAPSLSLNTTAPYEGTGYFTIGWSQALPASYGGALNVTGWDLSGVSGLRLHAQSIEAAVVVAIQLTDALAAVWTSPTQAVAASWTAHDFDFPAAGIDLAAITGIELRFSRAPPDALAHTANMDLLSFYRRTTFDETAFINQTVVKGTATPPLLGSARLQLDLTAVMTANVTADLEVRLSGPDNFTAIVPAVAPGQSTVILDPSLNVTAAGAYGLSLGLHVLADTTGTASVDVRVDNVSFVAPGYQNGSFLSTMIDLGGASLFDTLAFNASLGSGHAATVFARSGNSSILDGSWSAWTAHLPGATPAAMPPNRFVQFLVWLNTTSGLTTPTLDDLTLTYRQFPSWPPLSGSVLTLPFTPAEPLYRYWNLTTNETLPPGTAVDWSYSFDGVVLNPIAGGVLDLVAPLLYFSARLRTINTSLTPVVQDFTVHFEVWGSQTIVAIDPPGPLSATADDTLTFTANATDEFGHPRVPSFLWTTTEPGGLLAAGVYQPRLVGTWAVCVEALGMPASQVCANVTVGPGALAAILVTPSFASITADAAVDFNASGFDADGNALALAANWSTDDAQASVDANGTFTAVTAGSWTVFASNGTGPVIGTATVLVSPGALFFLSITPPSATVVSGASQDFGATGLDQDGNGFAVTPTWSTTDPGGNITATGRYTACQVGPWTVRAQSGVVWEVASVTVTPGGVAMLAVNPPTATITTDEALSFTATATDACGNPTAATPTWTTTDPGGTVDASGLYVPGSTGVWSVTATQAPASDSATVTVLPGNATRIDVLPDGPLAITADDTVAFTATGYDAKDTPFPFSAVWSTNDPAGAIGASGVYSAGRVGTWTVAGRSSNGTLVDTAQVLVFPGIPAAISLTPSNGSFDQGERIDLLLTATDADGNAAPLTATTWAWDRSKADAMAQTPATLNLIVRSGASGALDVTAIHGTLSVTATLTIAPPPFSVTAVPGLTLVEDQGPTLWDLAPYVVAGSTADLSWLVSVSDPTLATFSGQADEGQMVLTVRTGPDRHGTADVTLILRDPSGLAVTTLTSLDVTPVNDPPLFHPPPDLAVKAGEPKGFDYAPYVEDPDGAATLTLTVSDPVHAGVSGLVVTYTFDASYLGQVVPMGLNVSDGLLTATQGILINVTDNAPPRAAGSLTPLSLLEDQVVSDAYPSVDLRTLFTDDESLTITAEGRDLVLDVFPVGAVIKLGVSGERDWFGMTTLVVRARDPTGGIAEVSTAVTVTPVNDAPTIALAGTLHAKFDLAAVLDLSGLIRDVDTPQEDLVLTTSDSRAWFTGTTLTLLYPSYTLGNASSYLLPLTLTADDGLFQATVTLQVNVSGNAPPRLVVPLEDLFVEEDGPAQNLVISAYFADDDELGGAAALTYDASVLGLVPSWSYPPSQVQLTLTLPADWNGEAVVVVTARDTPGATAYASFTVHVRAVNDPPTFLDLPELIAHAGRVTVLDLRPYVSDAADGTDLARLSASVSSGIATAYGLLVLFEYPADASGPDTVVVTVRDDQGGRAERSVAVRVQGVQSPEGFPLWALLVVAAAVAAILAALLVTRRRYVLEDAFLLVKDGRLLAHKTRRGRADRDEDVFASMIAAIHAFARDTFREESETLKRFESQGQEFLVESGKTVYFAVIYGGKEPEWAAESMRTFVADVEKQYGNLLEAWSGRVSDLPGIATMAEAFVKTTHYRSGDWSAYAGKKAEAAE